jgi:CSLREA domain-containing protein
VAPPTPPAYAADFVVNTAGDDPLAECPDACTLRAAVEAANGNGLADEITFDDDLVGPIVLTQGDITIANDGGLTITGPGASELTVDANDNGRIFLIAGSADVTISGLTLTGGSVVGGNGGAILVSMDAALTLDSMMITGNSASFNDFGGDGGGIYVEGFGTGSLMLDGTTVSGNDADLAGGGIYIGFDTPATITLSTISGNSAGDSGGGIYMEPNEGAGTATISLVSTAVNDNSAVSAGGGIFAGQNSALDLEDMTISGNSVGDSETGTNGFGAGIYVSFASVTADETTIVGNNAFQFTEGSSQGGGIYMSDASVSLTDSTVGTLGDGEANTAIDGGGIFADGVGLLTLTRSTVAGNTANSYGGGIYLVGGATLSAVNSTVSGNAGMYGAGLLIASEASASLTHVTIANNQSGLGLGVGAGIRSELFSGTTTLTNVLIAGNTPDNCHFDGGLDTVGDNLSDDDSCPDDDDGQENVTVVGDAMIGGLAANGGLTLTHALLTDSPAIDAVDSDEGDAACPAEDQRTVLRPQGEFCDIGAFEFVPAADLVVAKEDGAGGTLLLGDSFSWFITITNQGDAAAEFPPDAVILEDHLPLGATYGSPSARS